MTRSLAIWFAVYTAAACASSGAGAAPMSDSTAGAPAPARRSANLITADEIAKTSARDGHHAVQLLRPDWLRIRGASSVYGSMSDVVVYLNGQRMGGSQALSQFQATSIKEMRFISASDATNRYGTGHDAGAILVTMK